jgi:hypothetical protein
MQYSYENLTFEEKLSAAGFFVTAFVSFYVPIAVCSFLGLGNLFAWFDAQSAFIEAIVYLPAWVVSYIIVAGTLSGLMSFAGTVLQSAGNAIDALSNAVASALNMAFYGTLGLAAGAVKLALYPLRVLCEFVWDQGQTQAELLFASWRERQEKRRLYRYEFRSDFRSFRDFERHFDNPGNFGPEPQPEPEPEPERKPDPPKPDAFVDACRLLGLPENGAFTREEFKTKFYAVMRKAHPDRGGSTESAMRANAAHDVIIERKGWS